MDALETEWRFSPLSLACGFGASPLPESTSEAIVRLLLDHGANPDVTDFTGEHAIHYLSQKGN